jgi:hypothetical protein
MAKDYSKPTFTQRGGYLVEVEWPDGFTQHVEDFGSESEALEWIDQKSDDWASKNQRTG